MERKKYEVSESKDPKYFISWGLGVQSTTLGVLSALGKIRKVDGIITADTQFERKLSYLIYDYYKQWFEEKGIPVYRVTAGSIRDDADREHSDLPLWYGSKAVPLRRQCTAYYKIEPIRRKIRELLGLRPDNTGRTKRNSAIMYLGISTDEAERMGDSNRAWIKNEYPLIDLRMSRTDCQNFLNSQSLPLPPKSACICCPYTGNKRWLELKENSPEEFAQAVEFDEKIRRPPERMLRRGFTENCYLHKSKTPLKDIDFRALVKDAGPSDVCDTGYCFI